MNRIFHARWNEKNAGRATRAQVVDARGARSGCQHEDAQNDGGTATRHGGSSCHDTVGVRRCTPSPARVIGITAFANARRSGEVVKREIVTLSGRVQAVGYRDRVIDVARCYAVGGTVRNLRSGALEIDVEGEDDVVDQFVAALIDERPYFARIDSVERRSAQPQGARSFGRSPTG
ncbi:MAG: acylphosphatase [Candidatus Eremiobacteraeota bacterium]|nr:acylphosphatase [Candidatus Eremiobacteraeota bacterium]